MKTKPTQYGIKIIWNHAEAPKFPQGWSVKKEFPAVAVSPDGKEYIIGDHVLYPKLKGPRNGPPKKRATYIDTDAAIDWPTI